MCEPFSFQPSLDGEFIKLRPLEISDYVQMYECASDKQIWQGHPNKDRYQEPVFREAFAAAIASHACLVVVDKRFNSAIGWSRFYVAESTPDDISIGFTFLAREYWGGTTNLELKTLMLDYAFGFFQVVWFHVAPSNVRSQKAIQKIGAQFVAEQTLKISGTLENWLSYRIEKDVWPSSSIP